MGCHIHPVAEGVTKQAMVDVRVKVKDMISKDFVGRPRSLQQKLAKEIVLQSALFKQKKTVMVEERSTGGGRPTHY